jgi:hypothetical protein
MQIHATIKAARPDGDDFLAQFVNLTAQPFNAIQASQG